MAVLPEDEIRHVLRDCVQQQAPVAVLVDTPKRALTGVLQQFGAEEIQVRMDVQRMPQLPAGVLCTIVLTPEDRSVSLLTPVVRVLTLPPTLVVRMPREALMMTTRRTLRVPLTGFDLQVGITDATQTWNARAVDISMGGMCVNLTAAPGWATGDVVRVNVVWASEQLELDATVVWCQGKRWGLSFSRHTSPEQLGGLTRVVCDVERLWLGEVELSLQPPA